MTVVMLSTGCATKEEFHGKCTTEKVDGKVVSVKVTFPKENGGSEMSATYKISDRQAMDNLIASLDSILIDLKAARDQMPIVEPKSH